MWLETFMFIGRVLGGLISLVIKVVLVVFVLYLVFNAMMGDE